MSLSNTKQTHTFTSEPKAPSSHMVSFKTNGYPESINRVFFEICNGIFLNQSEKFRNIANFSYSFTNAISEAILDNVEIDRDREIDIKAERTMGSIELSISYGEPVEDFSSDSGEPKTISLKYPVFK